MLTNGNIAKRAGVNTSGIRYYQRQDLLRPSRLVNGYRFYDEDAINTLRFLRPLRSSALTKGGTPLVVTLVATTIAAMRSGDHENIGRESSSGRRLV